MIDDPIDHSFVDLDNRHPLDAPGTDARIDNEPEPPAPMFDVTYNVTPITRRAALRFGTWAADLAHYAKVTDHTATEDGIVVGEIDDPAMTLTVTDDGRTFTLTIDDPDRRKGDGHTVVDATAYAVSLIDRGFRLRRTELEAGRR